MIVPEVCIGPWKHRAALEFSICFKKTFKCTILLKNADAAYSGGSFEV